MLAKNPLFKHNQTRLKTVCIVFSLLIIVGYFNPTPTSAQINDIYTVENLEVDITADTAVQARQQAFYVVQRKAFRKLISRIATNVDPANFEDLDNQFIGSLVKDFEIKNEKLSKVRYIGTYTFRFDQDSVQQFLNNNNLAYTDVGSKAILILPYYYDGKQTVIWSSENPWFDAWNKSTSFEGLVPVILPLGDLQDSNDIQNNRALNFNPASLQTMTERYNAREALIALAIPNPDTISGAVPADLTVMLYRTDRDMAELIEKIDVSVSGSENIFDAAIEKTRRSLQDDWKNKTTVDPMQQNNLQAIVNFQSILEWVETNEALQTVQGVDTVSILSLTPNRAKIALSFNGNESRLRLALAQSDITLSSPRVNFQGNTSSGSPLEYELYLNKYYQPF